MMEYLRKLAETLAERLGAVIHWGPNRAIVVIEHEISPLQAWLIKLVDDKHLAIYYVNEDTPAGVTIGEDIDLVVGMIQSAMV